MASERAPGLAALDIVCGTLQAKLVTGDLSSGSSPCILLGSRTISPCQFQREAGKAAAKNWKTSIRYKDKPLSHFLDSYSDSSGKRCCRFVVPEDASHCRTSTSSSPLGQHFSVQPTPQESPRPPELLNSASSDANSFCEDLDVVYREVVHWRRNVFEVPRGSAGKAFVGDLARLFRAVGQGSALEPVALKAVFVASSMLLQRSSPRSKPTDNSKTLGERMILWKNGDLLELLQEGRTIQSRLKFGQRFQSSDHSARVFAKLMFEGKTKAALQLLDGRGQGGVLSLDDEINADSTTRSVREILKSKHPSAQPLHMNCLLPNWANPPDFHPVIFDPLDGCVSCSLYHWCSWPIWCGCSLLETSLYSLSLSLE